MPQDLFDRTGEENRDTKFALSPTHYAYYLGYPLSHYQNRFDIMYVRVTVTWH